MTDGSTSADNCQCLAGYSRDEFSESLCSPCMKGKFKALIGPEACEDCPEHSTSLLDASSHVSQCICSPEYYAVLRMGRLECVPCAVNSRTDPANEPVGDVSSCLCVEGFFLGTISCEPCPAGTYKDYLGQSTSCSSCAVGATSQEASTSYLNCSCPFGFKRNADSSCTMCNAGKYLQGNECLECPSNSYSQSGSEGPASCTCRAKFYRATQELCQACPDFSTSLDGSLSIAHCQCNAGFYAIRGQDQQTLTCEACPLGSLSPAQSDDPLDCSCYAGWSSAVDGRSCQACEPGKYKPSQGRGSCSTCPPNSYSEGSANTACELCTMETEADVSSTSAEDCRCPANHYGSRFTGCALCPPFSRDETGTAAESSDCQCQPGYQGILTDQMLGCVRCSTGKYKDWWGNDACIDCGQHETSPQAATSVSNCLCIAGYVKVGNVCSECSEGTIKPGVGNGPECSRCPENSVKRSSLVWSGAEAHVCECKLGYSGPDIHQHMILGETALPCLPCAAGTYKADTGPHPCSECPLGSISPAGSDDRLVCGSTRSFVFVTECLADMLSPSCVRRIANAMWARLGPMEKSAHHVSLERSKIHSEVALANVYPAL